MAVATMAMALSARVAMAQQALTPATNRDVTPFQARKAEALLRDQLPCLGCHVLGGEGGRIGPDLTGVGEIRTPAYIAAIIADPQSVVPGSVMPRSPMSESTRELITRYLASRRGATASPAGDSATPGGAVPNRTNDGTPGPTAAPGSSATDGAALYARLCASCHGARGRGDGPNAAFLPTRPANHASREAMATRSDDALFDTIHGGGGIMNRSPRMPAYGATLTPAEIRSLVRHIRTLCRCEGPAWSRDGRGSR